MKRFVSIIISASILTASVYTNVAMAAPVATTAVEVTNTVATQSDATWVYATDVKTALPDGLDDGAKITENISIWNFGSTFKYKTNALVFNNGEYTAAEEFQIGKGNADVAADTAKGSVIDIANIEKALIFTTTGATDITVYAGIGSSGVENANIILVDKEGNVVDAGTIVRPGGAGQDHTVPTLTAPAAGEYYLLQPGNTTSLNVGAIKLETAGAVVDTTTESTTETTTESTTEATTEATTTDQENKDVAVSVNAKYENGKVVADYVLSGNDANKGFNNYTLTLDYDKNVLKPSAISNGTIKLTGKDALGNDVDTYATGKLNAETGKVVFCIYEDGATSETQLPEFTDNGVLFTITYDVVGKADSTNVGANIEVMNTVSSNSTIAGDVNVTVTPATVSLAASDVLLGDVNGDGKLTRADLTTLAQYFTGTADINRANSDIDKDNDVTRKDLTILERFYANLIDSLTK